MNTFHLFYTFDYGGYQLETCINTAIVRNVKKLYLGFVGQVRLPRCIFTCKTLVNLRLDLCGDIPVTGVVCLHALKKLFLYMVKYESDKSLEHLLSGCPVLEELFVMRFEMDPLVCCYISSPTLKRLFLNSYFANDGTYTDAYTVKIDTPALRYLRLHDSISNYFSSGPLTSLIEADVQFRKFGDVLYSRSVLEFVSRLYNVKRLNLSTRRMKGDDQKCWKNPQQVPTCLSSHLKTMKIDQFRCKKQALNMVRYLLRNAEVLEKMEIVIIDVREKAKLDAVKRISLFQRGFEKCELVFH
ncbi:hypothetical protein DH2020_031672 [Rehmannia glutinosa]|uniref:FBD domain-containing protein n=1 Tax=Rehmannia glutinosa TaxID=99300 RepID=A0ABR0VJ33_REHGL